MREASYTQSFRCLMKRAPQYKYIGCNPFSGRLTRSTRQMREHKTVSPNYRRLSTSTIVVCDEKILREMMLKLNDVCDCDEQFSWIVWVCVCFLGEKKKKWLLRPPSRCLLFRRLWFWCCLLLLLKQNLVLQLWFLLKTFSQIFDKVIKQWFRIVVGVSAFRVLDVWWRLNTFCSIVAVSIPFLLLKF